MNDDEIIPDSSLLETLKDTCSQIEERESIPYDGVYGKLPGLVPEWAVLFFEAYRDRLLKVRRYTAPELLKWIERYKKVYLKEVDTYSRSVPYMPNPTTYPNGDTVDRYCFLDEIGFLAWLKWCVFDLDEATAKKELNVGFNIASVAKDGLNKRHEPLRKTKKHCIALAKGLWDKKPEKYGSYSANDMATALWKDLDQPNQSHLTKPARKHSISEWLKKAHENGELVIPNFPK